MQHADLDGDGEPEILALGLGAKAGQETLVAFSSRSGRQKWIATVNAAHDVLSNQHARLPFWPLIIDVDGDGRAELVVPDSGPTPPRGGYRGIRMLDGPTGQPRWTRAMHPDNKSDDGLLQILDVPDINGDGSRDVVSISHFTGRASATSSSSRREPATMYVDAVSGKDGRLLWCWHEDDQSSYFAGLSCPLLWGRGPDGWPLLAVPLTGRHLDQFGSAISLPGVTPPAIHMLEMSTGRAVHTLEGLNRPGVADFDGDGIADLWGEISGHLQAFHGEAPRGLGGQLGRF